MGSTNGPVENSQCRIAPTPRPLIRARTGYATPARKIHSRGGAISWNAMTFSHTRCGEALMMTLVVTAKVVHCRGTVASPQIKSGIDSDTLQSVLLMLLRSGRA